MTTYGRLSLTGAFSDSAGNIRSGVQFTVCPTGTTTPATGYTDSAGTISAGTSFTGTTLGLPPKLWFAAGDYDVIVGGVVYETVTIEGSAAALAGYQPVLAVRNVSAATTLLASDSVVLADATGTPPPAGQLALTKSGSGGTFTAGNYYWTVSATGPAGESIGPNSNAVCTVATNGSVGLSWSAVTGATAYDVYRCAYAPGNPMAGTPQHLATVAAPTTTYTDTGTATSGRNVLTDNGVSFTLTLPDATAFSGKPLVVHAVGNTPNLVTLAGQSAQKIDGATTLVLGIGPGAKAKSVALASDGTNWRSLSQIPPPVANAVEYNTYTVTCPAGVNTPLVVVPVPDVIQPGQRMRLSMTAQVTPGDNVSAIGPSVNFCNSDGTLPGGASTDFQYPDYNVAYWTEDNFGVGEPFIIKANWMYRPRHGDWRIEGAAAPFYLGFHLQPTGGSATAAACCISVDYGAVNVGGWPML